eukprot:scaffold25223_cov153-Skeletonema_marinoi.AAC.2
MSSVGSTTLGGGDERARAVEEFLWGKIGNCFGCRCAAFLTVVVMYTSRKESRGNAPLNTFGYK